MSWLFKSKQHDPTIIRLADAINKRNECNLVSPNNSTYYSTELPFINGFKLYTYIDYSFTPYLKQQLLDNGSKTIVLDGTQAPFTEANSISPLILTTKNVILYTKLVLGCIQKNDNCYRLVTSIDDVEFCSEPNNEQYKMLYAAIKPPKVKKVNDLFCITANFLFNDLLLIMQVNVTFDGRVYIMQEQKVLECMPVKELKLEL